MRPPSTQMRIEAPDGGRRKKTNRPSVVDLPQLPPAHASITPMFMYTLPLGASFTSKLEMSEPGLLPMIPPKTPPMPPFFSCVRKGSEVRGRDEGIDTTSGGGEERDEGVKEKRKGAREEGRASHLSHELSAVDAVSGPAERADDVSRRVLRRVHAVAI